MNSKSTHDLKKLPFQVLEDPSEMDRENPELEELSLLEFLRTRNELLQTLRAFGTVGPLGESPLTLHEEFAYPTDWPLECEDPDFFVAEDPWSNAPFHQVEAKSPQLLTMPLVHGLWSWARENSGWCVALAFEGNGIFVMEHGVWAGGKPFLSCTSLKEVIAIAQAKKLKSASKIRS